MWFGLLQQSTFLVELINFNKLAKFSCTCTCILISEPKAMVGVLLQYETELLSKAMKQSYGAQLCLYYFQTGLKKQTSTISLPIGVQCHLIS